MAIWSFSRMPGGHLLKYFQHNRGEPGFKAYKAVKWTYLGTFGTIPMVHRGPHQLQGLWTSGKRIFFFKIIIKIHAYQSVEISNNDQFCSCLVNWCPIDTSEPKNTILIYSIDDFKPSI